MNHIQGNYPTLEVCKITVLTGLPLKLALFGAGDEKLRLPRPTARFLLNY